MPEKIADHRLTPEQTKKIVERLNERGVNGHCYRCKNKKHILQNALFKQVMQSADDSLTVSGPVIPVAVVICSNCGLVSQHALGALGFIVDGKLEL